MEFKKALNIKELNEHLIGKFYKNARIDELFIYPKNKQSLDKFMELYLDSGNAEESLLPFLNDNDFHVAVLCEKEKLISFGYYAPIDIELIGEALLD